MIIAKWGNSLAVRLPASLVQTLHLKEGDEIELKPTATAQQFTVECKKPAPTLADSFADLRVLLTALDEEEAFPTLPRTRRRNDFVDMLDEQHVV